MNPWNIVGWLLVIGMTSTFLTVGVAFIAAVFSTVKENRSKK